MGVIRLIILITVISGCGKNNSPLLKTYANEFIAEGALRGVTVDLNNLVSIRYGNTLTGADAVCRTFVMTGSFEIVISRKLLKTKYSRHTLKALVFHELGHCVLKLEHVSDNNRLMHPTLPQSDKYYKENWNYLLDQLFTK